MRNLLTEAKRQTLLVFNCLSWNLDFCLFLSSLSIDFYTRINRFCTSVSPILAYGHKMFVQLLQCSCVSPDWSSVPTSIPQAFSCCLCIRLCLKSKTLKAKHNFATTIVVSYSRLKIYGISRLINILFFVFRQPGFGASKD